MDMWTAVCEHIGASSGESFSLARRRDVGGGCINSACVLSDGAREYFVKLNAAARIEMFAAEAEGLEEIAGSATLRVPRPVCWGAVEDSAYLVMEYIALDGGSTRAHERLGEQLAAMHRVTRDRFGWHRDNTIGATPQINAWNEEWIAFMREHRLGYQYALAARQGYGGRLQRDGERLLDGFGVLFDDYTPAASLLHGDLWSGNYAVDTDDVPVVFDPAVYFGDREADLAMTELFGGFPHGFYSAYRAAYPLDDGYSVRKSLYNLYHILNHLNLFGGGYLGQAERMSQSLLAQIR